MRILLLIALFPILFSCASNELNFQKMSNEEIALYNASAELDQQVYCRREVRAGTHIKRRYCETLKEMENAIITSFGKLNTANGGTSFIFTTD